MFLVGYLLGSSRQPRNGLESGSSGTDGDTHYEDEVRSASCTQSRKHKRSRMNTIEEDSFTESLKKLNECFSPSPRNWIETKGL